MKKARAVAAWGISVVVGAGLLWACSSSTPETGSPGGGGSNEDATTGGDSSSYSTTDSGTPNTDSGIIAKKDSGTDGGASGPCGTSATSAACYQCCDSLSDGGVQEFFTLQATCICSPRHCDTVATCKDTFCKNPDVDDAGEKCNACQDKEFADDAGDAGCVDPVIAECAADMACNQGISCVLDSNCDSLP